MWSGLSLAGLIVGAVIGGRLAPVLLTGGSSSPYAPVFAVVGAITLAVLFEVVGSSLGAAVRSRERRSLRAVDSAFGVLVGALVGLVAVWVLGAMVLQLPGQAQLRRSVQQSVVLQRLNEIVPPRTILNALGRIDPFQSLTGPAVPTRRSTRASCGSRASGARLLRSCACWGRPAGSASRGAAGSSRRGSSSPPRTSSRARRTRP